MIDYSSKQYSFTTNILYTSNLLTKTNTHYTDLLTGEPR